MQPESTALFGAVVAALASLTLGRGLYTGRFFARWPFAPADREHPVKFWAVAVLMVEPLIGVRVVITAFAENYQPGIVGFEFADIDGRVWKFKLKFYDVSDVELDDESVYPVPGVLGCERVTRMTDVHGRSVAEIETCWDSLDGVCEFRVLADQLTEAVTSAFRGRKNIEPYAGAPTTVMVVTATRKT